MPAHPPKPISLDELTDSFPSPALKSVLRAAKLFAADRHITILLTGPTGTGKTTIAKLIHRSSPVAAKRFERLNLAGQDDNLAGSAILGHTKVAFTGALADRRGAFEQAEGGTVFLDEIDKCSRATQAKLLHVVDTGVVERIGDNRSILTDCRVVAATNQSLPALIEKGEFLEDLFARIDGFVIAMPSLAERREDIPMLANWYLDRLWRASRPSTRPPRVHAELMDALVCAPWPRNLRQLSQAIHRIYVLSDGAAELTLEHVDGDLAFLGQVGANLNGHSVTAVLDVLRNCRYNKTATATRLGCSRTYLHKWLGKHAPELIAQDADTREPGDSLSTQSVS